MKFQVTIDIEVSRVEGRFVSRDEITDIIQSFFDDVVGDLSNELSGLGDEGTSEYEVVDSSVEVEQPRTRR